MRSCQSCRSGACPMALGRRQFLAGLAAGASALAAGTGLLDVASAVATEVPKPAGKPKVRAVFLYPREHKKYWMSWPGHTFDLVAAQKLYTKTLTDAACELGIQLDVRAEPVETMDEVNALLGQLKQSPPDGVIVTLMHMSWWGHVNHIVKNKGALPTVVLARWERHLPVTFRRRGRQRGPSWPRRKMSLGWRKQCARSARCG